jgi:hypothetical protein
MTVLGPSDVEDQKGEAMATCDMKRTALRRSPTLAARATSTAQNMRRSAGSCPRLRLGRFRCRSYSGVVFRLIDMLANERDHVCGTIDTGESRVED